MWQQWVNLIVGLWIILSGYIDLGPQATTANLTIAGIVIALMALWGALEYRREDSDYGRATDRQHRTA